MRGTEKTTLGIAIVSLTTSDRTKHWKETVLEVCFGSQPIDTIATVSCTRGASSSLEVVLSK